MGRCKYEKLVALEPALDEIRTFENLKETKPGIFYFKSQGFLHFHEKDDKIWADVKSSSNWESIDVPEKITKKFLKEFVAKISEHYKSI